MCNLRRQAKRFGLGVVVWFAYGLALWPSVAIYEAKHPVSLRA